MATSKANGKKKPAAKKKAKAKKKVASKTAKKPTTASKSSKKTRAKAKVSDSERQKMIEEAAYYIAEQRNFSAGNPMDDWLAAEEIVNKSL